MPHMEGRSVVIFGSGGRIGSAAAGILRETGWRVEAVGWLNKSTGAARPWDEILAEVATIEGDVDIVFRERIDRSGRVGRRPCACERRAADRPNQIDHRPEGNSVT